MFEENVPDFSEKAKKTSGTEHKTQIRENDQEKQERKENLEKKFNEQKQKLIDLGYPEALGIDKDSFSAKYIEPLRKELDNVPENIPEGNIPFVIVIPGSILDIEKKMSMVKLGQEAGSIYKNFDFEKLRDAKGAETHKDTYLIYNIEDGHKTKGVSADNNAEQFAKENRRGFTLDEGIALTIHCQEILQDHFIDLPESRYGSESVPGLSFIYNRLHLTYGKESFLDGGGNRHWGSPSCEIVKK